MASLNIEQVSVLFGAEGGPTASGVREANSGHLNRWS